VTKFVAIKRDGVACFGVTQIFGTPNDIQMVWLPRAYNNSWDSSRGSFTSLSQAADHLVKIS